MGSITLTLKDIVNDWLTKNDYDGLYCNESGEHCCCTTLDLMPCAEPSDLCKPGKKRFLSGEPSNFYLADKEKIVVDCPSCKSEVPI